MTPDEIRAHVADYGLEHAVASLANELHAAQLEIGELRREMRVVTESIDTLWTPWWKKLWFWWQGWPLYRLAEKPAWRPWHRSRWGGHAT